MSILFLCLFSSLLVIAFGIDSRGNQSLPPLSPEDQLVFSESFEAQRSLERFSQAEPDLGHKAGSSKTAAWRVLDGKLHAQEVHNAALWMKTALPEGDVRVSFVATALTKEGDVKCEFLGDGVHHQSGYILINGGWKNTVRAIARQDEHGEDRHDDYRCQRTPHKKCIPAHQPQVWVIERRGQRIDWYIDGVFTLSYRDHNFINGRYFGFNNWSAHTQFDDLKVYKLASR